MSQDNEYFDALNDTLKTRGLPMPQLILDLDKFDQNLDTASGIIGNDRIRYVVKSLPAPKLIQRFREKTGSKKLMVFHAPFLVQCLKHFPDSDILIGKPLPTQLIEPMLNCDNGTSIAGQTQWLVDSLKRLKNYLDLAERTGKQLKINLEIDIGMHRGGIADMDELDTCLTIIKAANLHLEFTGFMGYDVHVAKAPFWTSSKDAALASSERYKACIDHLMHNHMDLWHEHLTFNGGGSLTYMHHQKDSPLNDVSIGSCLVMPTSFDKKSLNAHQPAIFIATPVLKRQKGFNIPFMEKFTRHAPMNSLFIYGGHWMAKPIYPKSMQTSSLFGLSSNQQLMTIGLNTHTKVGDFVFFRPTQSEAILAQFGDITCIKDQKIIDKISPFTLDNRITN